MPYNDDARHFEHCCRQMNFAGRGEFTLSRSRSICITAAGETEY